MRVKKVSDFLDAKKEQAADHLKRNSFSWVFGIIIPLYFFGTAENLKLLAWKVCVVCTGWIVFHIIRHQGFPYLDLRAAYITACHAYGENETPASRENAKVAASIRFAALCILYGLLGYATISSVAGGL